jgi:hypothetical protein
MWERGADAGDAGRARPRGHRVVTRDVYDKPIMCTPLKPKPGKAMLREQVNRAFAAWQLTATSS